MLSRNPELLLYLVGFAAAVPASVLLTFGVRELARRAHLLDPLEERKVHANPVPRIGGVAIVLAVALACGLVALLFGGRTFAEGGSRLAVVLAGALAIHLVGLWDDLRPMRARWKFVLQVLVAVAVFAAGVRATTLSLPVVGTLELGTWAGLLFTVVWFVGITNAFNLIDGLDGLASGAALFALCTMFVVASIHGLVGPSLLTVILAGATLGFLFFNFHPASIFLGDSGSLFLGFMLAGLGLLGSQKSPTVVAVAIPVVSLGLPVLDTTLAVARRFLRGQPIFSADRAHIHHRLLSLGHSPRRVALLLYGACALLALSAMLLVNDSAYVAVLLLVIGLGVGFAVQRLRYHEFEELARLVRRGVRQRSVIRRNVRIREASIRVSDLTDIDALFSTLQATFAEDFECAEVRLRRSLVDAPAAAGPNDRRIDDDVAVWNWTRGRVPLAGCWEIKLPFRGPTGDRIGSLVLWQSEAGDDVTLSQMHTIASELRHEVERKLVALWRPGAVRTISGEVAVPLPIVVEMPGGERAARTAADMPRQPAKPSSGGFAPQPAPLV